MSPITALAESLVKKTPASEQQKLREVVEYADRAYGKTMHPTGITLLEHALGVLHVLLPFGPDTDTSTACILQHALETKNVSITELEDRFGPRVRQFVSGIHLLSHVSTRASNASIDDLRLMLLSVADDIRVLLVILCKRCFTLERAEHLPAAERKRFARDAINLFAPVAARLGIHTLKQRLESLAFPIVYPADAERIAEQLQQVKSRHGEFIRDAAHALSVALKAEGISANVEGREKLPFSIFMKMKSKSLSSIERLPDLFAFRVVVATEADCYHVLGLLHRMGRPLPNRFKDYIAFPKPNGYQSLHTTVAKLPGVPEGIPVEVQVRTKTMHREAEYGIAAHWSYKEGGPAHRSVQRVQLQQALASQHAVEGEANTASRLADHIFVLTPKGDVIELPEGATPLDFAFQIHTDIGLSFRAARVNGSVVPLDYELENGDAVEIITQKSPHPSLEWLQMLKMASSRSRLRRYLTAVHRNKYLTDGKALLNQEFRRRKLPQLDNDLSLLRMHEGKDLSLTEREDLVVKIGQGSDKVGSLLQRLDLLRPLRSVLSTIVPKGRIRFQRKDALVDLDGDVPMPIRFAKCCKPQDGDRGKILGVVARTGEVTVHMHKCRNVTRVNPDRRIGVRWRKSS